MKKIDQSTITENISLWEGGYLKQWNAIIFTNFLHKLSSFEIVQKNKL